MYSGGARRGMNDDRKPLGARPALSGCGIEEIVRRLDELLRAMDEVPAAGPAGIIAQDGMLEAARHALWAQRERERVFGRGLFADPAWDILLELFVAGAEGRQANVVSVCAAAGVPETVALRCIALLVAGKLVRRQPHSADPQGIYLVLSDSGAATLCEYLSQTMKDAGGAAA